MYLKSVQTKRTSKGKESILYGGGRSLCYSLGTQYAYKVPRAHFGPKPLLRPWKPPGLSCIQPALIIPRSRYFSLPCINQRLELTDDGFSAMAESQLLPFFIRRPWPKCIFSHFVAFGRGRNAVFAVFHSSAVAESRFSAFRRPPTDCFHYFSCFVGRRRAFFRNFCISAAADGLFSLFFCVSSVDDECFFAISAFRRPPTDCFLRFSRFVGQRRAVFSIFHSSLTSETLFFSFSAFRSRAMNSFHRFPLVACKRNPVFLIFCISLTSDGLFSSFSILPRGGKYSLRHFSVFPNVGKLIFAVCHVSQCWDDLFLSFFMLPKFGKVDFHRFLIFPSLGKHFSVNACCFCNRFLRRFFLGVILKWCIFASRLIDGIS